MATLIAPSRSQSQSQRASSSSSSSVGGNSNDTVRVPLTTSAGFCVKSLTTEAGFYTYVDSDPSSSASSSSASAATKGQANLLEPGLSIPKTRKLQIPPGTKVFLNIAWDKRVPPPPEANEDVIRRAMAGADLDAAADGDDGGVGLGGYYVPVVVSEPREDFDKSGKPSIVFDCVFSASLKARCMKDKEFKLYLIELALEHVEEKTHMTLSRQIGTPNIASKGKLEPRTVLMPRALVHPEAVSAISSGSADSPHKRISNATGGKAGSGSGSGSAAAARASPPLVREIADNCSGGAAGVADRKGRTANDVADKTNAFPSPPKSILKQSSSSSSVFPPAANVDSNQGGSSHLSTSAGVSEGAAITKSKRPPLIEEVDSNAVNVDTVSETGTATEPGPMELNVKVLSELPPLRWTWTKDGEGRIKIEVDVPDLTRDLHARSTLDIEPRRILLHIPRKYFLDINLDLSDAQIGKMGEASADSFEDRATEGEMSLAEAMQVKNSTVLRVKGHNAGQALRLKRQRGFDVENARAEWRIGERKLIISV